MTAPDPKTQLLDYLQQARDAVVWKLDGLGDLEPGADAGDLPGEGVDVVAA